ncbi:MAG: hypothetical protein JJT88_15640 [Gammaproteobacteria bacterium]|nr:hypothetical protein [Gammaproteobacteria bacterium]
MSTATAAGGLAALAICDVVMVTVNMDRPESLPVLAAAQRRGCEVLVKQPLRGCRGETANIANRLRWAASRPGVTSVVVGSADPLHLAANARSVAARFA